jgi:hypothetical protein
VAKYIKSALRYIKNWLFQSYFDIQTLLFLRRSKNENFFDIDTTISRLRHFINSMEFDSFGFKYRYSRASLEPTLYSSVYACMTLGLIGDLQSISEKQRTDWIQYFDSFQSQTDGLFYDPVVDNLLFHSADYWGARHLALHIICAYTELKARPKLPFYFLEKYYKQENIYIWLESIDWNQAFAYSDDIDNKIMNIVCLLQYQRDFWGDSYAAQAVSCFQTYLQDKINPETGMWGKFDVSSKVQCSRMVQFAYHLYPIFLYDNLELNNLDKISQFTIGTQNACGGFGVKLNSSACEDIDSIDILIQLGSCVLERQYLNSFLEKARLWIINNQVEDGGFVFRICEPFQYGHFQMRSFANQGGMFPTWFRCLTLAFLDAYFKGERFTIKRCPGYYYAGL